MIHHRRHKHDIIAVVSLLGFGISLYLAIYHYLGYSVPCTITHGCETVLSSQYATAFGLPLAVWGVGYFTLVIISALLANHYALWRRLLMALLSLGAVGSLGLLAIQIFILHNICQYCLAVDILNILLFLWNLNIEHLSFA